jgi:hypothetical protein
MPTMTDASGVHQGIELLVQILEPRLGARGSLLGARVACDAPEDMSPTDARRLGNALLKAAEVAEEADRRLLPVLESFAEVRDGLLYEDASP